MKIYSIFVLAIALIALGCSSGPSDEDNVFTNSIGMKFKPIEPGTFEMGYPGGDALDFEKPAHQVTLSKEYYIGVYEVTQDQYMEVMGENPSKYHGDNRPVENVTKPKAEEFCRKLSELEGRTYRLPTDAEWEYACQAGTETIYWWGDSWEEGKKYVWYAGNSGGETHPVGEKPPNPWGLYDMPGNVSELVSDHFGYYWPTTRVDPTGPEQPFGNLDCTIRGVSWDTEEVHMPVVMRPSFRYGAPSDAPNFPKNVGFRVVLEPPAER